MLFNDSIYHNIAYGRPDASREEVIEAARTAQIRHSVESLPDGYETWVGERGLKLSGGKRQRVAIARILLRRPSILVFDETTSALDSRIEHTIQKELMRLVQNHTMLVVTHQLSTIVRAHRILVMEHGCIIERGTHESLLRVEGRYAQMWCVQAREPERVAGEAGDVRAG